MINHRRSGSLDGARGVRVSLTVPDPNTVMDFDFIAVYSSDNNVTLARIAVPSPLRVPPNLSGLYIGNFYVRPLKGAFGLGRFKLTMHAGERIVIFPSTYYSKQESTLHRTNIYRGINGLMLKLTYCMKASRSTKHSLLLFTTLGFSHLSIFVLPSP